MLLIQMQEREWLETQLEETKNEQNEQKASATCLKRALQKIQIIEYR